MVSLPPNHNIPGPPPFRYFPPRGVLAQIPLVLAAATAFIDFHNMARAKRLRADYLNRFLVSLRTKGTRTLMYARGSAPMFIRGPFSAHRAYGGCHRPRLSHLLRRQEVARARLHYSRTCRTKGRYLPLRTILTIDPASTSWEFC